MQCTSCGCEWETEEGFYTTQQGEVVQPCRFCFCDNSSVYYLNHHKEVRDRQNKAYYDRHEERKAYYREYRRQQRAQASA